MSRLDDIKDSMFECQQCGQIVSPTQKHDFQDCMKYSQSIVSGNKGNEDE